MRTLLIILAWLWIPALPQSIALAAETPPAPVKPRKIQVEEFDKLRAQTNHIILDVRSAEEFKAGHVQGAANLSVQDPDFGKKIAGLDRSKTYLVHCARGRRSALATDQLVKAGFTNLVDFTGGFDAWQKSGKPVVKE